MTRRNISKKIYTVFFATAFFAGIFAMVNADTVDHNETLVQASSTSSSSSTSITTGSYAFASSSASASASTTSSSYSHSHDNDDGSCDHGDHDDCGHDDHDGNAYHKIKICHVPPGNETNPHTITVDKRALSAHLEHGDYKGECKPKPTQGSITVCKIIVDEDKNVLYNFASSTTSFSIPGAMPAIHRDNPQAYASVFATTTFTTPLELNKKIFTSSTGNDAQCVTRDNLKLGDYYYGEEILPQGVWLNPRYNDQFATTVSSANDFFSYSGELFTPDASDDASRNENADGHIVLSPDRPQRTLIVLNTLKKSIPPPQQGKLKICKWNDLSGDGKSRTTTDDIPLPNWNFDITNASSTSVIAHLITEGTYGCTLSDLLNVGNYSIKEETRQNWNLTDVYVNGSKAGTIPLSTTTDVIAGVLMGVTVRVDFYNHYQEQATTTENHKPSITILGDNPMTITAGDTFTDPGATATDTEDGDITSAIVASSTVSTSTPGTYAVRYNVKDTKGLAADEVTRTVNVKEKTPTGGGGGTPAGSIRVCKIIADNHNTVATSSQGLPYGVFSVMLATSTNVASSTIARAVFNASVFATNQKFILSSQQDAQCTAYDNLSLGTYYYGEETLMGSAWGTTTVKYNDSDTRPINNIFDFFPYDDALFTATTTDDATREKNADGEITLTSGNKDRTLVVLNTYNLAYAKECSDGIDNDSDDKIDAADPACHTDGDANVPTSFDPNGDSENEKPVITLTGNATTTLTVGDIFIDPGATARDPEDGDITSFVMASSTVATSTAGTYSVTYTVKDSEGLAADPMSRTVIVNEKIIPPTGGGGGGGGGGPSASSGSSSGGGGGPIGLFGTTNQASNLIISNERVTLFSLGMALVSWDTNIPATSRVVYGPTSNATRSNAQAPQYGYASSTVTVSNLTTKHAVAVTNLPLGATTYLRPISTTTTASALGKELSVAPQTGECLYLLDYLRIDFQNNPSEVEKLQLFLKNLEGFSDLEVTRIFDQQTFDAVVLFQEKYKPDVLDPWGHDAGTGFVYITTKKKINELYCKSPFPLTAAQKTEIDAFRNRTRDSIPPSDIGNLVGRGSETGGGDSETGIAIGGSAGESTATSTESGGVLAQKQATGGLAALVSQIKTAVSLKVVIPIILLIILIILLVLNARTDKKDNTGV